MWPNNVVKQLDVADAHHGLTSYRNEPVSDQQGPPNVDITKFGWEVTEGIPSPCIATGLHAPQGLIDVINCGCKAEGKACSTDRSCSCHMNNMSTVA